MSLQIRRVKGAVKSMSRIFNISVHWRAGFLFMGGLSVNWAGQSIQNQNAFKNQLNIVFKIFRAMVIALSLFFVFSVESYAQRWVIAVTSNITLTQNVTLQNNNLPSDIGGGMYINNVAVNITGNYNFTIRNSTAGRGGGIGIEGAAANLIINLPNNTVSFIGNTSIANETNYGGGAILARTGAQITITSRRLVFQDNNNAPTASWSEHRSKRCRGTNVPDDRRALRSIGGNAASFTPWSDD
jgi:hypothetical protein